MLGMSSSTNAVDGLDLDPMPPTDLGHHRAQDYQSLLLHCAAVKLLLKEPALADRALATLARWRQTTHPSTHSLLDEWQDIVTRAEWHRAVATHERGNQLRQASPMGSLIPEDTRFAVLVHVKALRRGERPSGGDGEPLKGD